LKWELHLPFEHFEDLADQSAASHSTRHPDEENLKWTEIHADIIRRFGRFPIVCRPRPYHHTGRVTFLDSGGFAG
jgi:uncharacterized protein (DUF924 family)